MEYSNAHDCWSFSKGGLNFPELRLTIWNNKSRNEEAVVPVLFIISALGFNLFIFIFKEDSKDVSTVWLCLVLRKLCIWSDCKACTFYLYSFFFFCSFLHLAFSLYWALISNLKKKRMHYIFLSHKCFVQPDVHNFSFRTKDGKLGVHFSGTLVWGLMISSFF